MATKIYIEIPLSGKDLTLEEAREFAIHIEGCLDDYAVEPGKYMGREVGNVRVYKAAEDLVADLEEEK